MKRLFALFLALSVVVLCFASCNNKKTVNDDPVNVSLKADGVSFLFFLIPDETGVAAEAAVYQWLDDSATITIPETITYNGHIYPVTIVGRGQGICPTPSNVTKVVLSKNVKTVYDCAFVSCDALTTVEFNEGLETIGTMAFAYSAITEIHFPSTLKSIGTSAFASDTSLKSVYFNAGLETISDNAFRFCSGVTFISISRAYEARLATDIFSYGPDFESDDVVVSYLDSAD